MRTIKDLLGLLEGTGLFVNLSIKGDLRFEEDGLVVEYKKNPRVDGRRFERVRKVLGAKLRRTIEVNYSCVRAECSLKPSQRGIYSIQLTRIPLEGVNDEIKGELINEVYRVVKREYL